MKREKAIMQGKSEVVKREAGITQMVGDEEQWKLFWQYKMDYGHWNRHDKELLEAYMADRTYLKMQRLIEEERFPDEFPVKKIVNKEGTNKKRVVYSFSDAVTITLKFIAFHLYRYDKVFADNCYSFRKSYGVREALRKIHSRRKRISRQYCLKLDIQNYFNSIDTDLLLQKLQIIRQDDEKLYRLFQNILSEKRVWEQGVLVEDCHGAMAGLPVAPFFANVYLAETDRKFPYYRYSDDLILFGDSREEILSAKQAIYEELAHLKLQVNHEKETITSPGEAWEFLGFSYQDGIFDLSANTRRKAKAKIRRKADALRRWQRKKGLTPDKAAIGFIRAMNRKFYGCEDEDDFTWSRWFFGNLNTSKGLKEIDGYMQEYIRYTVTGRHYKGNYRITYDRMKQWGYRSLVHEYYRHSKIVLEKNR